MSISSNSDKAPRVSWTCEHCTYVNNPGVKVRCRVEILNFDKNHLIIFSQLVLVSLNFAE